MTLSAIANKRWVGYHRKMVKIRIPRLYVVKSTQDDKNTVEEGKAKSGPAISPQFELEVGGVARQRVLMSRICETASERLS